VDEIIQPNNPDHIGIVGVESQECKITSQRVMVPVHEDEIAFTSHNKESINEFWDFGDAPQERPIARYTIGLEFRNVGIGV
jgi:hypothetical protein